MIRRNPRNQTPKTPLESLECRALLSAASDVFVHPNLHLSPLASSAVSGFTPAQIKAAYGFNDISLLNGVAGDGSGQTIAIVDAYKDPNIAADLHAFDVQFSLSDPPSLKQVSQTGGTTSGIGVDPGWAFEISLDVEWAHAIAPQANILLVDAKSASLGDLMSAVDYARNAAGVSVVSMSWGAGEFSGETNYDSYFTTPAGHQNVTFVAASGDQGALWGPEWPASSSNVLSVGGTSLNVSNSSGAYSSESGWQYSTGGTSSFESEPSYQSGAQSTGARTSPDVSYNADPNTGFAVYDSIPFEGSQGWAEVGGTSAGAPQWAALVAIADQGRTLNKMGTLSSTGTLTTLYNLYSNPSTYANDFNDVTSGGTDGAIFAYRRRLYYIPGTSAAAGYDQVTGLGSPKAGEVVSALIGSTNGSSASTSTKSSGNVVKAKTAVVKLPSSTISTAPAMAQAAVARASESVMEALSSQVSDGGAHVQMIVNMGEAQTAGSVAEAATTLLGTFRPSGIFADARYATEVVASAGNVTNVAHAIENLPAALEDAAANLLPAHSAHIVPFGSPLKLLADGVASFTDESAAVLGMQTSSQPRKAWAITAAVVAADVLIFTYAYRRHRKRQLVTNR